MTFYRSESEIEKLARHLENYADYFKTLYCLVGVWDSEPHKEKFLAMNDAIRFARDKNQSPDERWAKLKTHL